MVAKKGVRDLSDGRGKDRGESQRSIREGGFEEADEFEEISKIKKKLAEVRRSESAAGAKELGAISCKKEQRRWASGNEGPETQGELSNKWVADDQNDWRGGEGGNGGACDKKREGGGRVPRLLRQKWAWKNGATAMYHGRA